MTFTTGTSQHTVCFLPYAAWHVLLHGKDTHACTSTHMHLSNRCKWLTDGVMDPAKADGSLEQGPKKHAGPQQCPGAIHDQFAMAFWAMKAVLYCSHTDLAVVGLRLLPDSCGVGMHHEQREDLHGIDVKGSRPSLLWDIGWVGYKLDLTNT